MTWGVLIPLYFLLFFDASFAQFKWALKEQIISSNWNSFPILYKLQNFSNNSLSVSKLLKVSSIISTL